jgi:quinol monooxygenase YgiN
MDNYYITATVVPKAGREALLEREITANIPKVRAEDGCLRYDLHVLRGEKTEFLLYEIWADKTAFEAHGAAPHMAIHRERIRDMVAEPTDVRVWKAVEVASE